MKIHLQRLFPFFLISLSAFSLENTYNLNVDQIQIIHSFLNLHPTDIVDAFPKGIVPAEAMNYLFDRLSDKGEDFQKSRIFLALEGLFTEYQEKIKYDGWDQKTIQYIRNTERAFSLDSDTFSSIKKAGYFLSLIRTPSAVDFLKERIAWKNWIGKALQVKENDRIVFTDLSYRSQVRENILHAVCRIHDATAEQFIRDFKLAEDDPDYRNLSLNINDKLVRFQREKPENKNDPQIIKVYDHLKRIQIALEAYYIDHNTYPSELQELTSPLRYLSAMLMDEYKNDQPYGYQKTLQGYRLWSVGTNGKKDDKNNQQFDDIVIEYP